MIFFSDKEIDNFIMSRRFNNPNVNVIFSSFKPLDGLLDQERTGIKWISLADRDLKSMVENIIDSVRDQSCPKHILVSSFQKYVGGSAITTMKSYIREIVEEVKAQSFNKLVFSTAWFTPNHERILDVISLFNKEVQLANESMGMARVNGHKALMVPIAKNNKRRRVRSRNWLEWQLGLGLGKTLSYEGQQCLIRYFLTVMDTTFSAFCELPQSNAAECKQPPSLADTPGYFDDIYMLQVLAARMIIPPRPEGEAELLFSNKFRPGRNSWKVHTEHGALRRFAQREGALEGISLMMRRGDSLPVWIDIQPVEMAHVAQAAEDADESDEIMIIEEEESVQQPEATLSEDEDFLINENEAVREVEIFEDVSLEELDLVDHENEQEEVRGEPEKKTEREYNEDMKNLQMKVDEAERKLNIAEEKLEAYKASNEGSEAKLVREKAAVKYWRNNVDVKEMEKKKLCEQLKDLDFTHEHTKESLKRMTAEYEFLRNVYSSERMKQQRVRVTRRYVKDQDFEAYGKNHK